MKYFTEEEKIKTTALRHLLKQTFDLHQFAVNLARECGLYAEENGVFPDAKKLSIYSYDVIMGLMKDYFHFDFTKRLRKREYVDAKHIACYILHSYTNLTSGQIATMTGNTNHSTALHGINKIKDLLHVNDPVIANDVMAISKLIEKRFDKQEAAA